MKNIVKYTVVLSVVASVLATGCIKETLPTGSSISTEQATSSSNAVSSMTNAIANYAANAEWVVTVFTSSTVFHHSASSVRYLVTTLLSLTTLMVGTLLSSRTSL